MRDLLNLLDNLNEGRGLSARAPGEKFKNTVGDIVTFQGMEFYPESGKVDDASELVALKVDAVDSQERNVHWVNQPNSSTGGFMIATFTGEDGTPYYLGQRNQSQPCAKRFPTHSHSRRV